MNSIHFGLLAEGSTDKAAIPVFLDIALTYLRATEARHSSFEWTRDVGLGRPNGGEIRDALYADRHDVLLVHRDGASNPQVTREGLLAFGPKIVPVVPVREIEAWLLVDMDAIRRAAGAPSSIALDRIAARRLERIPDPKARFASCVECCLGRSMVQRDGEVELMYALVAEHVGIDSLLQLEWFRYFIHDLRAALGALGWPFS